ncbi:MAG: hypothetical protein H6679_03975 [Epsilonproteobacteria bacterium]|nr:hypothetical protein [Campylobacterota bacterium]
MKVDVDFFKRRLCLLVVGILFFLGCGQVVSAMSQRDKYWEGRGLFGLPLHERMTKIEKIVRDQEKIEQVMDNFRKARDKYTKKVNAYKAYNKQLSAASKPNKPEALTNWQRDLRKSDEDFIALASPGRSGSADKVPLPTPRGVLKKRKWELLTKEENCFHYYKEKFNSQPVDQEEIDALDNTINKYKKALKMLRENSDNIAKALVNSTNPAAKLGSIIARGLAGQQLEGVLEDSDIDSVSSGIEQGVYVRVAGACGDVLGEKLKGSINRMFGGAWDFAENQIVDGWNVLCNVLFHASRDPFTSDELTGWDNLLDSVFKDIEALLKEGPKDSSRSYEMTLRQLQEESDEASETLTTLKNSAWRCLIEGYADQIDFIAGEFEDRKVYYKENNLTNRVCSFYISQIVKRLLEFRDILLEANSLSELDRLLDFNKQMVGAYKKNILMLNRRLSESLQGFGRATSKDKQFGGKFPANDFNKGSMGGYGSGFDNDKPYPGSFF